MLEKNKNKYLIFYLSTLIFTIISVLLWMFYYVMNGGENLENILTLVTAIISFAVGMITLIIGIGGNVKFSKTSKKNLENYELEIDKFIQNDKSLDVSERMKINLVDIKEYYI